MALEKNLPESKALGNVLFRKGGELKDKTFVSIAYLSNEETYHKARERLDKALSHFGIEKLEDLQNDKDCLKYEMRGEWTDDFVLSFIFKKK